MVNVQDLKQLWNLPGRGFPSQYRGIDGKIVEDLLVYTFTAGSVQAGMFRDTPEAGFILWIETSPGPLVPSDLVSWTIRHDRIESAVSRACEFVWSLSDELVED